MGLPADLFVDAPGPDLLCLLCRDVLDDPASLPCGHLFCRSCLLSHRDRSSAAGGGKKFNFKGVSIVCPTCRRLGVIDSSDADRSLELDSPVCVKSIIENMQIRCRTQHDRDKRSDQAADGNADEEAGRCVWTGRLCEYNSHAASDCPLIEQVKCKTTGRAVRVMKHKSRREGRGYGYGPDIDTPTSLEGVECVAVNARKVLAESGMEDRTGEDKENRDNAGHLAGNRGAAGAAKEDAAGDSAIPRNSRKGGDKENQAIGGFGARSRSREDATGDSAIPGNAKKGDGKENRANGHGGIRARSRSRSGRKGPSNKAEAEEGNGGDEAKKSGGAISVRGGGLLTQRAVRLCLEADRILSRPRDHEDDETKSGPSLRVTPSPPGLDHESILSSPNSWTARHYRRGVGRKLFERQHSPSEAGNAGWKKSPPFGRRAEKGEDGAVEELECRSDIVGSGGRTAGGHARTIPSSKSDVAKGGKGTDSEDGGNAAFVLAAVKMLVSKEVSKIQRDAPALAPAPAPQSKGIAGPTKSPSLDPIRAMFVRRHLVDFCRQWIRGRPDALHGFVVYRPAISDEDFRRLLVGIPGPRRTGWEGGLFPVLMEWRDAHDPPTCKFPVDFHHANVRPASGEVCLSTLRGGWHPEITIPELLFDLQQLLAHPNHDDAAQRIGAGGKREADDVGGDVTYDCRTAIQTSAYGPSCLLATAAGIDGPGEGMSWSLVDGASLAGRRAEGAGSPPREPSFEKPGGGGVRAPCRARCSCCAWGQTLWDGRREMRYLFGKGGS